MNRILIKGFISWTVFVGKFDPLKRRIAYFFGQANRYIQKNNAGMVDNLYFMN